MSKSIPWLVGGAVLVALLVIAVKQGWLKGLFGGQSPSVIYGGSESTPAAPAQTTGADVWITGLQTAGAVAAQAIETFGKSEEHDTDTEYWDV